MVGRGAAEPDEAGRIEMDEESFVEEEEIQN
jgi:hypothetical protein